MDPETQRNAATTLRPTPRPGTAAAPWITWTISGAAVIVVLAAGAIFLGKGTDAPSSLEAEVVEPDQVMAPPREELTVRGPLDLSAWHLDAQERAHIWNESAALSGIHLVIEHGAPLAAVEFEFGISTDEPTPGTRLERQRHIIAYQGSEVTHRSEESNRHRVALTPPNCTLDAAFRAVVQAGIPRDSRIGVMLLHSEKHHRPVWLMTTSDGNAYNIDADSCVQLRR